jgi:hypothetical protein
LLGDAYLRSASVESANEQSREQSRIDASAGIKILEALLKDYPRLGMARACLYGLYRSRALTSPEIDDQLADWDKALAATDGDLQNSCRIERAQFSAAAGKYRQIADEANALAHDPAVTVDQLFAAAACYGCCVAAVDTPADSNVPELVKLKEHYVAEALGCLRRCQTAGGFRSGHKHDELANLPAFAALRVRSEFQDWIQTMKP